MVNLCLQSYTFCGFPSNLTYTSTYIFTVRIRIRNTDPDP